MFASAESAQVLPHCLALRARYTNKWAKRTAGDFSKLGAMPAAASSTILATDGLSVAACFFDPRSQELLAGVSEKEDMRVSISSIRVVNNSTRVSEEVAALGTRSVGFCN